VIGNGAHGTALRVTLANDSTGTVAATCIQATASNLNAQVVGNIAHSSGASGNPVAMSAIAQDMDDTGPPNQVDAENDVVRIAADRDGGVFVHTHGPRIWSYAAEHTTTQTNTSIKTGPASGLSFYITDIYVVANGAVTITIEDTTAVLLWRYYAAAAGDGAVCNFTTPIKVVATRGIQLDTSAAVTVFISVNGYTAAG